MNNKYDKIVQVYLGRFCPFHEGHNILLTKLINKFGLENCLVIIGSANVINNRTPYSFEERKKMIKNHFPEIEVIPFDDVGDNKKWLRNLKKLEKKLNTKFVFYGGSKEDLEVLSQKFQTEILIDRFSEGKGISGTQIRAKQSSF